MCESYTNGSAERLSRKFSEYTDDNGISVKCWYVSTNKYASSISIDKFVN